MPDVHFEPFLFLAGLTHDDALIAWGGFYFQDPDHDGDDYTIVEDPEIAEVAEAGRHRGSIGASSKPFGKAHVEVVDLASGEIEATASTADANHVWVRGLQPDTAYRYTVTVDGEVWAAGPRLDWIDDDAEGGRDLHGRGLEYDTRFRTFPAPGVAAPVRFAVLGDYGVGVLAQGGHGDRQRHLGAALERAVDHAGVRFVVTTGDNVYIGEDDTVAGTGAHDDDWYFSFFEPYRYAISRVPVYPGVGNHDSDDTEQSDDRDQLADNLFTDVRFAEGAEAGRSSVDPGLYYRFTYGADVEMVAIDTTTASSLDTKFFFQHDRHRRFLEEAFPAVGKDEADESVEESAGNGDAGPRWRIPFSHHPPFCAGPKHHNHQALIDHVVPLLRRSGVRLMLSGHEHNFQHNRVDGIDYLVTGAAGKLRDETPDGFADAGTLSWAAQGHFLLVDVDGDRMTVHPVTDVDTDGALTYLEAHTPDGAPAEFPIHLQR